MGWRVGRRVGESKICDNLELVEIRRYSTTKEKPEISNVVYLEVLKL